MAVVTPAQLAAEFAAQARKVAQQAGSAVIKTAADIQRDAKLAAPVDTGFLRASISRETRRHADGAESWIGPEAHYGRFVEEGTSRMGPQPYLYPAAERHQAAFEEAVAQIVSF